MLMPPRLILPGDRSGGLSDYFDHDFRFESIGRWLLRPMRSETHRWGIVRCPNDLLLFFGEISAEEFSSIRLQPNASIGHFDASEDVGWVLVELILNGLARGGATAAMKIMH